MTLRRPAYRLMLALAVLGGSGCASQPHIAPVKPYGAATLGETDLSALSHSLEAQAKQAGILHAVLNLFPDHLAEGQRQGETIYPGNGSDKYQVTGILSGPAGLRHVMDAFQNSARSGILTAFCHCASTGGEIAAHFKQYRIFVALHEDSHMMANAAGDNAPVDCRERSDDVSRSVGLGCNRNDRIADVSTGLYILSNYGNPEHYPQVIENMRLMLLEPIHMTVSSLVQSVEEFQKNPKRGLSIAQTERWAARIVDSQAGLDAEYDLAAQAYRAIDDPSPVVLPLNVVASLQTAAQGRAALFGPLPRHHKRRHELIASAGR